MSTFSGRGVLSRTAVIYSLKAPYSSKIDIFIIRERFNKLIYGIDTIITCGT